MRLLDLLGGRRNEVRVARPCSSNPVLRASKLSRLFVISTAMLQQLPVHLSKQTVRQREAIAQPSHAVLERGNVVRDFDDIVERSARGFLELEQQQVGR